MPLKLLSFLLFPLLMHACALAPAQPLPEDPLMTPASSAPYQIQQDLAPILKAQEGKSGIYPLNNALDAFSVRVMMTHYAVHSLDVQYYIWRKDNTGTLLLNELYQAGERGVRVRLLLDDLGTSGLDDWLSLLDSHPNIEVKLFNPFSIRTFKHLNFITDFSRLNRRMHNKSLTVDKSISVVGGRNIGDEYFAASTGVLFADLDVLTLGPVVDEINQDFERYWQSPSAYPISQIVNSSAHWDDFKQSVQQIYEHPDGLKYLAASFSTTFFKDLINQSVPLIWAPARLVSDDPAKGLGQSSQEQLLSSQLTQLLGEDISQLDVISPYFVPSKAGTKSFVQLAQQGSKIRVLTNALEATDVTMVHSGYSKYRKPLLKAGIELFEMQGKPSIEEEKKHGLGMLGSSSSSLHAKTFAANQNLVFVGSFNFDPRSTELNTEMGILIEDADFAQGISQVFDGQIQQVAYQVKLDEHGDLYWQDSNGQIYTHEPNTGLVKRSMVRFFSWLPLDWLL